MADISALGLQPVETLDLENYAVNRESTFQLPAKGRYTLRAPDAFPTEAFGTTRAGALSVQIDPTIVGPSNEGFVVRYTKVSAKPFDRRGVKVSQLGDYLMACGVRGVYADPQALADAAEMTAGQTYEAILDWSAYNKNTGFSLDGMEKFPKKADGTYQSWIEDPTPGAKDEHGNPVRLRANLRISRFIPQGE
jgi:hypothetical protein